ncbi:single-stranded DNA-binding protein [uncultured Dubosiella sp.]|uniref:single-stranded DNA-binding protein n=1 Tax=uncultured Dubosiella sp. TaxID=1937011 RepID=UPI002731802E|nr:single-stranded DNA-binding protein [uncultured Dubosiella sp.]
MINSVILVGRLTKDPELRKTQSGTSVCAFTLAVNRKSQAQGQPDADFIGCVAWNKTAELMEEWLHKGSLIGVEGRIQTRNYDNQQGQRVYITEVLVGSVTFLEPKGSAGAQNGYGQANAYQSQNRGYTGSKQGNNGFHSAFDELDIASDDLPF